MTTTTRARTAGIIGGMGPESTVDYYRSIIALYRERRKDGSYPSILVNSIDVKRMLDLVAADRLTELANWLGTEIRRLADAGADFGLLSSNTPHIVFDALSAAAPIPLISIVETACQAAQRQGLTRVGLLGTRFTMQGRFYAEPFSAAGIEVVTPGAEDQAFVHEKYMRELVPGVFRPETRSAICAVIERLRRERRIDGLVLAGTELPVLLREAGDLGVAVLDTTKLHVERVVDRLLA